MITSRASASGISVIKTIARTTKSLVSSLFRSPFTGPDSAAEPAMPPITPGPACPSSHSSNGPSVA